MVVPCSSSDLIFFLCEKKEKELSKTQTELTTKREEKADTASQRLAEKRRWRHLSSMSNVLVRYELIILPISVVLSVKFQKKNPGV